MSGGERGRRNTGYWAPFNIWWRAHLEKHGERPKAEDLKRWFREESRHAFPHEPPTYTMIRNHAKGLRDIASVKHYFRDYRARKRRAVADLAGEPSPRSEPEEEDNSGGTVTPTDDAGTSDEDWQGDSKKRRQNRERRKKRGQQDGKPQHSDSAGGAGGAAAAPQPAAAVLRQQQLPQQPHTQGGLADVVLEEQGDLTVTVTVTHSKRDRCAGPTPVAAAASAAAAAAAASPGSVGRMSPPGHQSQPQHPPQPLHMHPNAQPPPPLPQQHLHPAQQQQQPPPQAPLHEAHDMLDAGGGFRGSPHMHGGAAAGAAAAAAPPQHQQMWPGTGWRSAHGPSGGEPCMGSAGHSPGGAFAGCAAIAGGPSAGRGEHPKAGSPTAPAFPGPGQGVHAHHHPHPHAQAVMQNQQQQQHQHPHPNQHLQQHPQQQQHASQQHPHQQGLSSGSGGQSSQRDPRAAYMAMLRAGGERALGSGGGAPATGQAMTGVQPQHHQAFGVDPALRFPPVHGGGTHGGGASADAWGAGGAHGGAAAAAAGGPAAGGAHFAHLSPMSSQPITPADVASTASTEVHRGGARAADLPARGSVNPDAAAAAAAAGTSTATASEASRGVKQEELYIGLHGPRGPDPPEGLLYPPATLRVPSATTSAGHAQPWTPFAIPMSSVLEATTSDGRQPSSAAAAAAAAMDSTSAGGAAGGGLDSLSNLSSVGYMRLPDDRTGPLAAVASDTAAAAAAGGGVMAAACGGDGPALLRSAPGSAPVPGDVAAGLQRASWLPHRSQYHLAMVHQGGRGSVGGGRGLDGMEPSSGMPGHVQHGGGPMGLSPLSMASSHGRNMSLPGADLRTVPSGGFAAGPTDSAMQQSPPPQLHQQPSTSLMSAGPPPVTTGFTPSKTGGRGPAAAASSCASGGAPPGQAGSPGSGGGGGGGQVHVSMPGHVVLTGAGAGSSPRGGGGGGGSVPTLQPTLQQAMSVETGGGSPPGGGGGAAAAAPPMGPAAAMGAPDMGGATSATPRSGMAPPLGPRGSFPAAWPGEMSPGGGPASATWSPVQMRPKAQAMVPFPGPFPLPSPAAAAASPLSPTNSGGLPPGVPAGSPGGRVRWLPYPAPSHARGGPPPAWYPYPYPTVPPGYPLPSPRAAPYPAQYMPYGRPLIRRRFMSAPSNAPPPPVPALPSQHPQMPSGSLPGQAQPLQLPQSQPQQQQQVSSPPPQAHLHPQQQQQQHPPLPQLQLPPQQQSPSHQQQQAQQQQQQASPSSRVSSGALMMGAGPWTGTRAGSAPNAGRAQSYGSVSYDPYYMSPYDDVRPPMLTSTGSAPVPQLHSGEPRGMSDGAIGLGMGEAAMQAAGMTPGSGAAMGQPYGMRSHELREAPQSGAAGELMGPSQSLQSSGGAEGGMPMHDMCTDDSNIIESLWAMCTTDDDAVPMVFGGGGEVPGGGGGVGGAPLAAQMAGGMQQDAPAMMGPGGYPHAHPDMYGPGGAGPSMPAGHF